MPGDLDAAGDALAAYLRTSRPTGPVLGPIPISPDPRPETAGVVRQATTDGEYGSDARRDRAAPQWACACTPRWTRWRGGASRR